MSSGQSERRAAADSALASVRLEGFSVPEGALLESKRFIAGKIDFQELINRLYQQANKRTS